MSMPIDLTFTNNLPFVINVICCVKLPTRAASKTVEISNCAI